MKPIFSILALATLALAGCAPTAAISTPSPTPTEIIVPTPTATPLPPTATATAIPNALENKQGQALLGLGYEQAQLKEFTSFAEGEYSFPGDNTVTYHGIIGTKADGSKEMLAIKFSDNPNYIKLSSSEMQTLGEGLCSQIYLKSGCFETVLASQSGRSLETYVDARSTGILESIDIKDESGNIVATTRSMLLLTKSDNGFIRLIRDTREMESPSKPGQDLFLNRMLRVFGIKQDSTQLHSPNDLVNLIPRGMKIRLGIEHAILLRSGASEGKTLFVNLFTNDQDYSLSLESFLSSGGVIQTTQNPINILSNSSEILK